MRTNNSKTATWSLARLWLATLTLLAFTACEDKEAKKAAANAPTETSQAEAKQTVSTVEFNGKKIPITVHYTSGADYEGDECRLDSLAFTYNGVKQTVLPDYELNPFILESPSSPNLTVDDYNFDDYMDISIYVLSGTYIKNKVFLYAPQKQAYYLHKELNELWSFSVNKETQTIEATILNDCDSPEDCAEQKEYKWIDGKLTLVQPAATPNVKLLESIAYNADNAGNELIKFEYDNQNRIVKILRYYGQSEPSETITLTYSGYDLVGVERSPNYNDGYYKEWTIKGDTIETSGQDWETTMTVDKDGYITKQMIRIDHTDRIETTYKYKDGNLIKQTEVEYDEGKKIGTKTIEYEYDNKNSPFRNCKIPKWFLQDYFREPSYASKNNSREPGVPFDYDFSGFPLRKVDTRINRSMIFKYIGGEEAEAAARAAVMAKLAERKAAAKYCYTVETKTEQLRVRGCLSTHCEVLGWLENGATVCPTQIMSETDYLMNELNEWAEFKFEGKNGYILFSYLKRK